MNSGPRTECGLLFFSRTAELKTYNANLVKMRSGLLKYLDRYEACTI
jgi:hypothetical protein